MVFATHSRHKSPYSCTLSQLVMPTLRIGGSVTELSVTDNNQGFAVMAGPYAAPVGKRLKSAIALIFLRIVKAGLSYRSKR
jgi:hypothetical protein